MSKPYIYILTAVSGAAVLALEILGTRILGPFYGVSIFLWSALITVTLAGLSLGYLIGGRMADAQPAMARLCTVVAIAGIWIILIPWIKHPFLALAEPMGLRLAVLTAATILFFPPLTLLGMVSPFVIKLATSNLSEVGRTTGTLFAISTLASVVSAFLTGFYLIPNVGVIRLTLIVGIVLVFTAIIGYRMGKVGKVASVMLAILLLPALSLAWWAPGEGACPENGLLTVEQSLYGELRVVDERGARHLLIDGGIHTVVDTVTWESYAH